VLLYPSGRISHLQEQQLTTIGQNITALEVQGSFDDCQDMVKRAFMDKELSTRNLTSANSINLARWMPQGIYHAWCVLQADQPETVLSIPSGNFGNLASGLLMYRMGIPVKRFIAATNDNSIVPEYLDSGKFEPRSSVATISNAMDVGNPSNFVRMLSLFEDHDVKMTDMVQGFSLNDTKTRKTIKEVQEKYGYTCDPHGAVAYAALKELQREGEYGVFFETAHPAKFGDIVNPVLGSEVEIPLRLEKFLHLEKSSIVLPANYEKFKQFLLS
jgi:threonine synthase